jgi:hypothetical protein
MQLWHFEVCVILAVIFIPSVRQFVVRRVECSHIEKSTFRLQHPRVELDLKSAVDNLTGVEYDCKAHGNSTCAELVYEVDKLMPGAYKDVV